jgi:hypothetical protein
VNEASPAILGALPADIEDRTGLSLARDGRTCEGAAYHSPSVIGLHSVELEGRTAHLCGTCRDNLVLLGSLADPDWEVRRSFGNKLRRLIGL